MKFGSHLLEALSYAFFASIGFILFAFFSLVGAVILTVTTGADVSPYLVAFGYVVVILMIAYIKSKRAKEHSKRQDRSRRSLSEHCDELDSDMGIYEPNRFFKRRLLAVENYDCILKNTHEENMLIENPFFILLALLLLGLGLAKLGLFNKLQGNQGSIEQWFGASQLRTFGIPLLSAVSLTLAFYLFGGIAVIAKIFAYAFVGFIFTNFVYRVSGRHSYRLGVSLAFMFVFFGSITSLILFNLG